MATKNQQPFFPHDANSRNRDSIIRLRMEHGAAGYGVYFMLLERLRGEETFDCALDYDVLAFDLDCDIDLIRSVIYDFGLFEVTHEGTRFHSIELSDQMAYMLERKKKRAEAARAAAAARWGIQYNSEDSSEVIDDSELDPADSDIACPNPRLDNELMEMRNDNVSLRNMQNDFGIADSEIDSLFIKYKIYCEKSGLRTGHKDMSDAWFHLRAYVRKMKNNERKRLRKKRGRQNDTPETKQSPVATQSEDNYYQSGDNYYRNRGYEPSCTPMRNLMDPEWVSQNPPPHPEWIGKFRGREKPEDVIITEPAETKE